MKKLDDLKGIQKYFCSKCQHFHLRRYKNKIGMNGKIIKTKETPFFNHKEFAYQLSSTEQFRNSFKKNWNNYSIKQHQKYRGSMKQ